MLTAVGFISLISLSCVFVVKKLSCSEDHFKYAENSEFKQFKWKAIISVQDLSEIEEKTNLKFTKIDFL